IMHSFITEYARCLQGDFNGDGMMDVCSLGPENMLDGEKRWVGLSNGDGTFGFTAGTNALPAHLAAGVGTAGGSIQTGDFNGDGRTDLFGVGQYESERWLGISNGDGTFDYTEGYAALSANLDVVVNGDGICVGIQVGDFNGDGRTDICSMGGSTATSWVGLSNGNGRFGFKSGTNAMPQHLDSVLSSAGSTMRTGDFNGDGRTDVCSVGPPAGMGNDETRWLALSTTNGTFDFTWGTNMLAEGLASYTYSVTQVPGSSPIYALGCAVQVADFNGDGLTDLCSLGDSEATSWVGLSNGDGTFDCTSGTNFLPANLEAYVLPTETGCTVLTADFNGDGLADIYSAGDSESQRWLGLSKGDGTFDFTEGYAMLPSGFAAIPAGWMLSELKTGDFNGDGRADVCSLGYEGLNYPRECRWIGLSNGDGTFEYISGDAFREGGTDSHYYSTGDFNGDGLPEIFGVPTEEAAGNTNFTWLGMNGNQAARLEKVVQGYQSETQHGVVTQIEYLPLTDPDIYVKGSGATWPVRDVVPAMHVVSTLWKDNGQGGTYATDYTYRSARRHFHGRGFLGFQQFESYDRQTQISTVETLAHDFPFTGRVLQTETYYIPDPLGTPSAPGYAELVSLVENDWQFDLVTNGTLFAFNPKSVATTWELGNTNDVVTQTTTWNWYDNQNTAVLPPTTQPTNLHAKITYGNLVQSVVDYGDGGLKQTTVNSYDDWVDPSHWLLGRLDESTVTHEATNQTAVVRSSSFDYDEITGLLSQETIEPDDAQFELITDYYYDSFGNITNKTLTPAGLSARTILSNEYDSKGRFVEKSWNALDHETVFVNDQETGKPKNSTDPNGLTTSWSYDPTGRMIHETRPDAT
ncbi:MAG: hypothetical protein DRR04_14795, partial [Gammaproteobacteria bacterium]